MGDAFFTKLPDDVVLNIIFRLQDNPTDWARLACVSARFSTLIRTVCCRSRCLSILHSSFSHQDHPPGGWSSLHKIAVCCPGLLSAGVLPDFLQTSPHPGDNKRRKIQSHTGSHLASGTWTLSREQGNKLLAGRFREDELYICDWPGCIHAEEKRSYMLFRGVFKHFKRSRVWRTISDGHRRRIDSECAFCACNSIWDLQAAFCLRRPFGYHDDGEPVVRAYVCENGHVSGAWTHLPLYT